MGSRVSVATLPEDFASSSFLEEGRRYNWTKTVHIAVCEVLASEAWG